MNLLHLLLFVFCGQVLVESANAVESVQDRNGGVACAACSILVGLAEQLSEIYNETITESLARFCSYLPSNDLQELCKVLVDEYGPGIIHLIEAKETPDVACYGVGLCKHDTPNTCHLFPFPTTSLTDQRLRLLSAIKLAEQSRGRPYKEIFKGICDDPLFKQICNIIERFGNDHEPLVDIDGDHFSREETFRGTSWRGKDCNDFDSKVYPGRRTINGDKDFDSNCNGIFGIDTSTGRTFEEQWCNGTGQMGVVVLGDSVGAHFHIPPEYLTAKDLSVDTFTDLLFILENEFDWPMLSMTTGHFNSSRWKNSITGPMDSIYSRMVQRNRCNHRDYQNIAVNGARSSSMNRTIVRSLARHQKLDYPLMIILELIGNDVCSSHHDTTHMTTPQEFHDNYLSIFKYLDSVLPKGSIVLVSGLVDGRILYDSLHDHIHPIGSLRGDVTYTQMYEFLNCLEVSPCFGWMNANETWRNITTERAEQLNKVLRELVSNATYNNFELRYHDLPTTEVFNSWVSRGGKAWQLIEPVDGFHPNQLANALTANVTWGMFETLFANALPSVNPYNDLIVKKFGDQGGY